MHNSERFQFGTLDLPPEVLPSPRDLYEAIKTRHRETARTAYLGDSHDEYTYCHFQYNNATDDSDTEKRPNTVPAQHRHSVETSRVLYFDNGQFAFEPTREGMNHWVPNVLGTLTGTDVANSYTFYTVSREAGFVTLGTVEGGDGYCSVGGVDDVAELRLLERGSREDGGAFVSGTVIAAWNEDDWSGESRTERRAETIRRKLLPHLRTLA